MIAPTNRGVNNLSNQVANRHQPTKEYTSTVQREEYSSNATYSSAEMSSVKSEFLEKCTQSQAVHQGSSRMIKSVAQESSMSQSFVYQGEDLPHGVSDRRVEENIQDTAISVTKQNETELKEESHDVVQENTKEEADQVQATNLKDANVICEKNYNLSNLTDTGDRIEISNQIKVDETIENTLKQKTEHTETKSLITEFENLASDNKNNVATNFENNPLNISESLGQTSSYSMVEALTIAPDRPYSPLPSPQPNNLIASQTPIDEYKHKEEPKNFVDYEPLGESCTEAENDPEEYDMKMDQIIIPEPSPIFTQQPKREITPIPPLKVYNPPEKLEDPIPMPQETKPYIPSDFKITVEPQLPLSVPRESSCSPLIEALTTVPDRPFTPNISANFSAQTVERGSLREALTIAPDRPFSPLPINVTSQSNHYTATTTVQTNSISSEIFKPIATQSINVDLNSAQVSSNILNTYELQTSSQTSAFKPVTKQVFPPSNTQEFNPSAMQTKLREHTGSSDTISTQQSSFASNYIRNHGFSSVKATQHYFEELDRKESLSSSAIRSKSGLHKPDRIPPYQKNFEMLPSQRGISPDMYREKPIPQRPVTPSTDPPTKRYDKSQERQIPPPILCTPVFNPPQIRTTIEKAPIPQNYLPVQKENPISMTFQPVTEGNFMRVSPIRSRPSTPSLINKPAPIIPHYQMNLVPVEHLAPESHLYEAPSREGSRSPTPKPRSRSPAPGPPPNPLKAQAPRIKDDTTPQVYFQQSYLPQNMPGFRKENEIVQRPRQSDSEYYNAYATRFAAQDQNSMVNEQRYGNIEYKTESCAQGDMNVKQDLLTSQQYDQRQMLSQNTAEYGNTTVQTTRKTFEEFERKQSAKLVEIRKGSSSSFGGYQLPQQSGEPSNVSANQIFPPPALSLSSPPTTSSFSSSINLTNNNVANAIRKVENYQPSPSSSGANQGPVCDPTPSAGASVGGATRGKTFGVSSAPKRGRGILNKPAVPGSRVPLCASCNGNIRGPFITALGRIWCPEHFICVNATCRRPLQDIGFVEENGQLYCEFCFEQYIAPSCDKCHAKIKGDCLNAIGKHFHPECFSCVYCGKLFGNNPFFLEDGLPYCEADWNELFTTKCFACGFPVEAGDRWVEALNNNYHSQCFNCTVCKKNLEGQSFFAKGGRPFCKSHAR